MIPEEGTLHHEAGHAVVAYCLLLPVLGVSVIENGTASGVCTVTTSGSYIHGPSSVTEKLAVCYAGWLADALYGASENGLRRSASDLADAYAALKELPEHTWGDLMEAGKSLAWNTLLEYQHLHSAIVDALRKTPTIGEEEFYDLMDVAESKALQ